MAANTETARASLPFLTKPQEATIVVGDESTGTLEFPVYNDLTVNESAWLSANQTKETAFTYTSKAALKIARAEKIKPIDAHGFVAKVLAAAMGAQDLEFTAAELEYQVKYIRDLEETAFKVLEISVASQQMLVTAVIRHRLEGMSEWGPSDTANMPSHLCEAIYEFALKEQSRGVSEDPSADTLDEVEELLGKSKTEFTTAPPKSTGRKRSTRSANSTRARKSSAPKDSEDSGADTSSNA